MKAGNYVIETQPWSPSAIYSCVCRGGGGRHIKEAVKERTMKKK